ncbi:MAG: hypothetical protein WC478_03420, partial [Candidatus Omnitrophota bacterium]
FTGIGSTLFVNAPDLTIGNLFGANTYNLVNIGILDFLNKGGPLLSTISVGQLLTSCFSIIPLSIAAIGIFIAPKLPQAAFANISLFSILILLSYILSARKIFAFEQKQQQLLKELNKEEKEVFKYDGLSLKTASIRYAAAAAVIAAAGIWLAYIGDDLSRVMGLGRNFIGTIFLGFATTLPEITVSVAAIRLGAKELAVANLLGSNLFNIVIIFVNDAIYRKAPIFNVVSGQHVFTALVVILMTMIVIAGLILKPKQKTKLGLSYYAIGLIVVFLAANYINFITG